MRILVFPTFFLDCLTLQDGAPYVVPKRPYQTTNLCCVNSQKNSDLRMQDFSVIIKGGIFGYR